MRFKAQSTGIIYTPWLGKKHHMHLAPGHLNSKPYTHGAQPTELRHRRISYRNLHDGASLPENRCLSPPRNCRTPWAHSRAKRRHIHTTPPAEHEADQANILRDVHWIQAGLVNLRSHVSMMPLSVGHSRFKPFGCFHRFRFGYPFELQVEIPIKPQSEIPSRW